MKLHVLTKALLLFQRDRQQHRRDDNRNRSRRRSPTTEADRHVASNSTAANRRRGGRFDPRLRRVHHQTPPSRRQRVRRPLRRSSPPRSIDNRSNRSASVRKSSATRPSRFVCRRTTCTILHLDLFFTFGEAFWSPRHLKLYPIRTAILYLRSFKGTRPPESQAAVLTWRYNCPLIAAS